MRPHVSRCILAGLGLALATQAHAASVTGTINASLTLTAACQVNGSAGTSGLDFGSLSFGTQEALFGAATGQVLGAGGGAMSVLCSAGTVPAIRVGDGTNDGQSTGGTRALADGLGNFVPYDFYTDAGLRATGHRWRHYLAYQHRGGADGQPVWPGGRQARAAGGVYTDTVAVELSF